MQKTEALPAVAAAHRIGDGGILVGHSLGGLFSLYALLEEPSLFDGYFAFGPSVWLGEEAILDELNAATREGGVPQGSLFLSLGDREGNEMLSGFEAVGNGVGSWAQFRWHAEITRGAGHGTNPVLSFPAALKWYYEVSRTEGDA